MATPPPRNDSRLVYSTDGGRVADQRNAPSPRQPTKRQGPGSHVPEDGVVRISRDSKGRRGKTATVISGLPGDDAALDALLKQLKQACGAGGSREGRLLEIQGDHRERLEHALAALGHKVKLAGG